MGAIPPQVGAWGVNYHPDDRSRMTIMIPKGDNPYISDRDRAEWAQALRDRPDLAARLLEGKPGAVQLGQAVAQGFSEVSHVSKQRLYPVRGVEVFLGVDFGLTPCVVVGQEIDGRIQINAALPCERGGIRQHIEECVRPWLSQHASWVFSNWRMIIGCYDPAGDTPVQSNIDESPARVLEELLPGDWQAGPVSWEGRKGPLLGLLNRAWMGQMALQIDPIEARPLIRALAGGWFYQKDRYGNVSRDLPKKNHPHSDVGDSFCYLLTRCSGSTPRFSGPVRVETAWNPLNPQADYVADVQVESDFDPFSYK